ncbi:MAG: CRISPR-associated RAMP protein [Pirellulaceae bacterium]|jgi:CRISPR-associated RAMP protein (TIGR02581 family)|nr:MAG: CRISPR-associated RAMP protein [Pirellulaceae bacterium]
MNTTLDRSQLRARYRITGRIVLDTALHIGGGRNPSAATDSPVVRDGAGRPFIPGSSLKGAFRAAVERLVPNISGLRTCGLSDAPDACANRLREELKDRKNIPEAELLKLLESILCDTCRTFGTTHLASVTLFHDAPIADVWRALPEVPTQVRDGVGIDRDSERAREGIKYDFEVVPPQTSFDFALTLENPTERDLGLIALGLQEFIAGMIPLGGIRSRGLGRCHLEEVKVGGVDLSDRKAMTAYLLERKMTVEPTDDFIRRHLSALLTPERS